MSHQPQLYTSVHPAALIIRRLHRLTKESPNSNLANTCNAFRQNLMNANDLGVKLSELLLADGFYEEEILTCIDALCLPRDPSPELMHKLQQTYEQRALIRNPRTLTYRGVKYKQ